MKKRLAITLCLLCCASVSFAQKKVFDRGYDLKNPEVTIASKGSWSIGGNAGVSASYQDNYDFFVVNGINARSSRIIAAPQFCYMLSDNFGVGGRLRYARTNLTIDSLSMKFNKTEIKVLNYDYVLQNFSGAVFCRYYKPFGKSGRFAGYADAELGAGGTSSNVTDSDGKGGYSRGYTIAAGIDVGIIAFLTAHLGIDVRLGLLEFGYSSLNQQNNVGSAKEQTRVEGSAERVGFNLMLDPFAISFGVHYYL